MYLTASNLVHYLMSRGLVTPESILDGDFTVVESRRRNRNFQLLRAHNRPLFVKQAGTIIPETTESIRREAACYQLAAEDPDFAMLQAIMPRLIEYNRANHALVTELVADSQNLNEFHTASGTFPEEIARLQGRMLGTFHSGSLTQLARLDQLKVFPRMRPFVLSIALNAEAVMPNMSQAVRGVIAQMRQQPELVAQLNRLWTEWQQICLIHGDVKWDNFLLLQKGNQPPSLKLMDWELADIADPAWDVAGAFTAYVQNWLLSLGTPPPGTAGASLASGDYLHRAWPALGAFWSEYAQAMPLSGEPARLQLQRCIQFTGARLVLLVFELLQFSNQTTPAADMILRVAREVLVNPMRAQAELFGLKSPLEIRPRAAQIDPAPLVGTSVSPAVPPPSPRAKDPEDLLQEVPQEVRTRLNAMVDDLAFLFPAGFRFRNQQPVYFAAPGYGQFPTPNLWPGNLPPAPAVAPVPGAEGAAQLARQQMVETLWPTLYQYCYTSEQAAHPAGGASPSPLPPPDNAFVAWLSSANQSRSRWDPSWEVYQVEAGGGLQVKKGDLFRFAMPGEFAFLGGTGRAPAVGDRVDLLVMQESSQLQNGFYFAFGETLGSMFDDSQLGRVYFNATVEGIGPLLKSITTQLNHFRVPFRFKCLSHPSAYQQKRGDAAVLFIAKRYVKPVLNLLAESRDDFVRGLNEDVPLFAKQLLPGMSVADDPGTGESFGQSRMRLVSSGLINAWQEGKNDPHARLRSIGEAFRRAGISLKTPHLNPGNTDLYEWQP